MELSALPQGSEGVAMHKLINEVLPFRSSSKYIEDWIEKMRSEGITIPDDLLRVGKEALTTKLQWHANFNHIEMADTLSLRAAAAKAADPKQNDRSRSPRGSRKNGRDNSKGRGGQRNKSWPQRNRNSSQKGNCNTKEKVKPELWNAVAQGDATKVQDLLEQEVNVIELVEETFEGWSPLMKASENGDTVIMTMLINKGANIEATNRKGRTALSFAAAPSNDGSTPRPTRVEAIRLLLQFGADAMRKDKMGQTAKSRAANEGREDAKAAFEEFFWSS